MPSTTIKPEVNVPLRLTVTGAAIWPGREWEGKQLPAQLSLKGTIGGSPDVVTVYVPADLAGMLTNAGASRKEVTTKAGVKGTAYELPASRREWIICKRQAAGEKHPHTELYEPDSAPQPFTEKPKALETAPEVMPWDGKPAVHLERDPGEMTPLEQLFGLYDECFAHALALAKEHPEVSLDVAAMTATAFIQATKIR